MTTVELSALPAASSRSLGRLDLRAVGNWALVSGLVLYLGFDGGGYGMVVHSQVAIVVWWAVLVGAAWGLLPAARLTRAGWCALALFAGFVVWTEVASTWSISSERSAADLSLVAGYLGVLVLGLGFHRDRDRALRHTVAALASACVIIALVSLASRLHSSLFPAAAQTASFIPGSAQRLAWPLNYWNALAALLAFAFPLLLALAVSARNIYGQAAAAAAIPAVTLAGYLTFSRAGAAAAAVAVLVFLALPGARLRKLATALVTAAGSAVLIAEASARSPIERGLLAAAARHQGATLVLPIVLVCAGVAFAQVAILLAARRRTIRPRAMGAARRWLPVGGAAVVVALLLADAPAELTHAWRDFKRPAPVLNDASLTRFSSVSGDGRYYLWRAAVQATHGHLLGGSGPGTYQLLWLPRAVAGVGYVQNAHSLYFETLAELGVVGLVLLVGFIVVVLVRAVLLAVRSRGRARGVSAGAVAALAAFVVSAGFDWIWQLPVIPIAFLLLSAAVLAPSAGRAARARGRGVRWQRIGAILLAAGCLVAVGVPLATANAVSASQAAASRGHYALAVRDALQAAKVEPGAASPQLQLALVEELQGNFGQALQAADRAVRDEPANWDTWLVRSRLEAEAGHPALAIAAFRRARALNPESSLFAG